MPASPPHRRRYQWRYARPAAGSPDDRGIALLATMIVLMIVTALLGAIFLQDIEALPLARHAQDYQAALQAADAGVEDYLNRLDNNSTYYLTASDPSNPALENGSTWTTWAAVPGTNVNEWFRYAVNAAGAAQSGIVYLTVTGAAGQNPLLPKAQYSFRTVRYALKLSGFTNFLYYTDYEIVDPSISHLPLSCKLHAYDWNGSGYGPPSSCSGELIYFVGKPGISDQLNGPIFSNDEFHVCGNPSFPQGAVSYYDAGSANSQPGTYRFGNPGDYYGDPGCTNSPTFGGSGTQPAAGAHEGFPTTNQSMINDIGSANNGGGCAYVGPTTVTLFVSSGQGRMKVSGTLDTTHTPSSLRSPTNLCVGNSLPLPPNGLIYDENGTCGTSCQANVSVSGVLKGQLTIGSQTNITITNNLTVPACPANSACSTMSGSDMLGLSATNSIILQPPTNQTNLTVDAAMVALDDSIYLYNWTSAPALGTLYINGSLAQEYRGAVGQFTIGWNGNYQIADGFTKDYTYDSRLRYQQPPYFTSPTLPNWTKSGFTECTGTPTPSTAAGC